MSIPEDVRSLFTEEELQGLIEILSLDPRPSYQDDPERVYGLSYAGRNVKFKVTEDTLTVTEAN